MIVRFDPPIGDIGPPGMLVLEAMPEIYPTLLAHRVEKYTKARVRMLEIQSALVARARVADSANCSCRSENFYIACNETMNSPAAVDTGRLAFDVFIRDETHIGCFFATRFYARHFEPDGIELKICPLNFIPPLPLPPTELAS